MTVNLVRLGSNCARPSSIPRSEGHRAGLAAHLLQVVLEVEEGQVSLHLADHFHSQSLLFMDDGQVQEPEGKRGKTPQGW